MFKRVLLVYVRSHVASRYCLLPHIIFFCLVVFLSRQGVEKSLSMASVPSLRLNVCSVLFVYKSYTWLCACLHSNPNYGKVKAVSSQSNLARGHTYRPERGKLLSQYSISYFFVVIMPVSLQLQVKNGRRNTNFYGLCGGN